MAKVKHYPPVGFSKRLRDLYILSGLTQDDIARRVGCERKSIIAYIRGDSMPNILILARLCYVFNVSADYLLFGHVIEFERCKKPEVESAKEVE